MSCLILILKISQVSGGNSQRCFGVVDGNVEVLFTDLVVKNCFSSLGGAGFYISRPARVALSTVILSTAQSNNNVASVGGGIYSNSALSLTDVTVSSGKAKFGAALSTTPAASASSAASDAVWYILDTELTGGVASGAGGGVYFHGRLLRMTRCTVSSNYAPTGGGVFHRGGQLQLNAYTFGLNTADDTSKDLYLFEGENDVVFADACKDSRTNFGRGLLGCIGCTAVMARAEDVGSQYPEPAPTPSPSATALPSTRPSSIPTHGPTPTEPPSPVPTAGPSVAPAPQPTLQPSASVPPTSAGTATGPLEGFEALGRETADYSVLSASALDGWVATGTAAVVQTGSSRFGLAVAPEGDFYLALEGQGSSVSRSIAPLGSGTYEVSFDARGRKAFGATSAASGMSLGALHVSVTSVDGTASFLAETPVLSAIKWHRYSYTFSRASAGPLLLTFNQTTSEGDAAVLIDDIYITSASPGRRLGGRELLVDPTLAPSSLPSGLPSALPSAIPSAIPSVS